MSKTILITGAGSGLGEGAAINLAQEGHRVIAGVQIGPQVAALREKANALGLSNLRVEKLDLLDFFDVSHALHWDFEILVNNAAIGEAGPVSEIPIEIVRKSFETNVFAPLALTQGAITRWRSKGMQAKIVFVSSVAGLMTPEGMAVYAATKHAIEAIAEAMHKELRQFGIQVQTINPGQYLTGFNEVMAETPLRWLDPNRHFTTPEAVRAIQREFLGTPRNRMDPQELIEALTALIPAEVGKFRNVIPPALMPIVAQHQSEAWGIDL